MTRIGLVNLAALLGSMRIDVFPGCDPEAGIARWTEEQCREAEEWGLAVLLERHGGHEGFIEVPPEPAHVAALPRFRRHGVRVLVEQLQQVARWSMYKRPFAASYLELWADFFEIALDAVDWYCRACAFSFDPESYRGDHSAETPSPSAGPAETPSAEG